MRLWLIRVVFSRSYLPEAEFNTKAFPSHAGRGCRGRTCRQPTSAAGVQTPHGDTLAACRTAPHPRTPRRPSRCSVIPAPHSDPSQRLFIVPAPVIVLCAPLLLSLFRSFSSQFLVNVPRMSRFSSRPSPHLAPLPSSAIQGLSWSLSACALTSRTRGHWGRTSCARLRTLSTT